MFNIFLQHCIKSKKSYQIGTFPTKLNSHKPLVYYTCFELWILWLSFCVCDLNLVDFIHIIQSFCTGIRTDDTNTI